MPGFGSQISPMNVVIVELPAKAKTINKYLGKGFKVLASYGHVRDLPPKDGSVRPDEHFAMSWQIDGKAEKRLKDITDAVKGAEHVYLATDPDREGEAISWHIQEVLKNRKALKGVDVKRVVFNEITKSAVLDAFRHPRELNRELVDAYLARRALDYLVGFTLSPVLWRKLPGSRSAGRVQSVALRLICERESEIEAFKAREYWTIEVEFQTPSGERFTARLTHLDGKRLDKFDIGDEAAARAAAERILRQQSYAVAAIEKKQIRRNPPPPFTTSTLQQEASRKLGLGASRTMRVAQRLYEGVDIGGETVGLITYMRTDGVAMSAEAIEAARRLIETRYGETYRPDQPRIYKTQAKNAQEAHEAIRPTDMFGLPEKVGRDLEPDQLALYELIWKRTVASQMSQAVIDQVAVDIASPDGTLQFRATGSTILFDGFLTLYREDEDDIEESEENRRLPPLRERDLLARGKVDPQQHFTQPPPRYSEASLVKKLEELGIGRPSTYASIMQVLQDRDYVRLDKKRFIPEDRGRVVTAFLESFFERYVEYDFTADLENKLDEISGGRIAWKKVLEDFWRDFSASVAGTKDLSITQVIDALDEDLGPHFFPPLPDGSDPRLCPGCGAGRLSLKLGKFGAFIGCSNYPECRYTRPLARREWRRERRAGGAARARRRSRERLAGQPAQGALRLLRPARPGRREREAQARLLAQGRVPGRRDARPGAQAAVAAARNRNPPRRRQEDRRRHRPLRPLYQAWRRVPLAARRRRRAHHRHQPRRGAPGRAQEGRRATRADAAARAGPPSPRRRAGQSVQRPLRTLCQPWRRQRHLVARHRARDRDAGTGARAAERAQQGQG